MTKLSLSVLLVALLAGNARADREHDFSISLSPVHLIFPIVEIDAEYRAADHVGLALIAGAGRVRNETDTVHGTASEIGGQFNYYPFRSFAQLHGGFEALFVHISDVDVDSTVTAGGLSMGPYVGYKVVHSSGFTFIAQLGVSFVAIKAKSSTASEEDKRVLPLLNLNIGWSF